MLLPLRFWADVFSPVADISTVCLISRLMLLPCC